MALLRNVVTFSSLAFATAISVACSSDSTDAGGVPGPSGQSGAQPTGAAGNGTSGGSSGIPTSGAGPLAGNASGGSVPIAGGGGAGGTAPGAAGSTNAGGAGSVAQGGMSQGGTPAAGAGGGGVVTPYVPAWTCLEPTWPSADPNQQPVKITSTKSIGKNEVYDGHMALHDGDGSGDFGKDCSAQGTANQGTTKPLFELEDGATIQHVVLGKHAADGIHCKGTCTIKDVWFPYVCDDAVTALSGSSGTVTIDGGGAKNAHDKLFQDNSHGKFIVTNFYGEKLGKMYRACGAGGACDSTKGNLTMTNVTAVGVDQIAGVTQGRDTASFSKICTFQTGTVCEVYDKNDKAITDGPDGTTCKYSFTDTQVMLKRVTGVFGTAALCPNYLTSGSASNPATTCLKDLPSCIKSCLPGDNGLKMCDCTGPNNTYKCHGCALPAQEPAKTALSPAKALAAPACASGVTEKKACSGEWSLCTSSGEYCGCVFKPGYLQTADTVWDCTKAWW